MIERGLCIAAMAIGLAACATQPTRSVLDGRIDGALNRGGQAVARDDWREADAAFAQAQTLALSIEDERRWAQASLNRAWIAHRRGQADAALLQRVADMPGVPQALRDEAALRGIAAALRAGRTDEASSRLAHLGPELSQRPMAVGLAARLAEAKGESARAAELATSLLAQPAGNAEQANARRLLARQAMAAQRWPIAREHIAAAEALDAKAQDSEGLLDSLELLAGLETAAGDADAATTVRERQARVATAYCARFTAPWAPARCASPAKTPTP